MTVAVLVAWLAASSVNGKSPFGETIRKGPFGELVSVGLDDVPPVAPAGCLPLFTLASGYVPTWAAPEGQPSLADRAQHVAWLAGAGRGFPAVVAVAAGQTMRQACTAAGFDPDADIVGIPEAAFDLPKATRKHLPSLRGRLFLLRLSCMVEIEPNDLPEP